MVYPDLYCWDNEGDIDPTGFNTNTGMVPQAIKAMVERVTATSTTGDGSSTGGEGSTTGGEGSTTGGEGSSTGGETVDSCTQYQASITEALESIESVRDFANGRIPSHTQFDSSLLEDIPTSCDLSASLQDIRAKKLRLRHIVIRAAIDQLRAERAPWTDIRSTRE
jgi:hypothetical protein